MAVWETEDELSGAAAASLPTPADTPYRTPSKRSQRSVSPVVQSSPAPLLPSDKADRNSKRSSRDITTDQSISILDPRRFTPTLHANLVSEILTLRRDQEEKLRIIETLESRLHTSQEEHEALQSTHSSTAKENRSLKRQMSLLEGGTSNYLRELARERDDAVEGITEIRKRLEAAQKKIRAQEEDSQRVHDLWDKEKDDWAEEKRKYERKLHVADSHLRKVLEEVEHLHAAQQSNGVHTAGESEVEETATKENDAVSVRTMSMTNSIRYSTIPGKVNGNSLADELNGFDDDDSETDADGRQSVMSNTRHRRNLSRDSMMSLARSPSKTHRRDMSADSQRRPGSVARGRLYMNQTVLDRLEAGIREDDEDAVLTPKPEYKDTGIQFSPPPSPKLVPAKPKTPEPVNRADKLLDMESPPRHDLEIEANQSRKRVHIQKPVPIDLPTSKSMVSSASQTVEEPLSPPRTPTIPFQSSPSASPVQAKPIPQVSSIATQTEEEEAAPVQQPMLMPSIPIPSISIIPPTSRPTTPREHRLPQYVKDVGCQISMVQRTPCKSTGVQTDEIRIDKRLKELPPHLHPSAVKSRPTSPIRDDTQPPLPTEDGHPFTPLPGRVPPRNPRRLAGNRNSNEIPSSPPFSPGILDSMEIRDAYPGNNDDGPLSNQKAPTRRPHRISSLFAGFEAASSDEGEEFGDGDLSDGEFRTALSAPKHQQSSGERHGHAKRSSTATNSTIDRATIEQAHITMVAPRLEQGRSSMKPFGTETYSSFSLEARKKLARAGDKPGARNSSSAGAIRKSAMIQSGIASHQGQGRSRSPSLPDAQDPPFPIPTRASSRKPPMSASAPSDGQRSPTKMGDGFHRRGMRSGPYRSNSIRKVRSAAAIPRNQRHRRQDSDSPLPLSPTEVPESPMLPPLPTNDITTPRRDRGPTRNRGHKSQPSTTTANTDNTNIGSVNSSQQASHVVDAIAQTMVGEWMFKYVRRRKSFSVADSKSDENSNDRHKRWVWLAPYERAILWSSKQPSTGSALMGKSGRKRKSCLTIQSVLDVKDDNPTPKGVTQLFNRSILILTPQRALKFTAVSAERHYLWLTSLSFLAHSQQAIPEIATPATLQATTTAAVASANSLGLKALPNFGIDAPPPPPTKTKKPGIRDSIMLKKGKNNASFNRPMDNTMSTVSQISINAAQLEEALGFKQDAFAPMPNHNREFSREVAEPPFIPRYHERAQERVHERANQVVLHGRKRSNTGGHIPPPLSFRGFSGPMAPYHALTNSTAGNSVGTAGSSDIYSAQGSNTGTTWGMSTNGSQRTSEASSRPANNFFEAIGTVRMEAFISPLAFPRFNEFPDENEELRYRARRRSKEARRRRSRSRHRDSYNSRTTRGTDDWYGSRTGGEEDYFRDDPFKGF